MPQSFEDLECWKAGREVRLYVWRDVLSLLPPTEKFRLADQLLRAARSVTANIAEGYGRFHYLDTSKFFSVSRGSCCEVLDHLITACDEQLIPPAILEGARPKIVSTLRLINGYMSYLKRSAANSR